MVDLIRLFICIESIGCNQRGNVQSIEEPLSRKSCNNTLIGDMFC